MKLETTRLREESLAKAKIDEELRTAWTIQSRLLPAALPQIDGYSFAGSNRPEGMPVVKRRSGSSFCMPMIES